MKALHRNSLMLVSSLSVLLALGGCDRGGDSSTVGQKIDSAIKKTEELASKGKEEAQDAAARARASAKNAGDDTKAMGAATADKVDDDAITTKVNSGLATDKDLAAIKIDVDSRNGVVTLTGSAPSASARDRAAEIARNVKGVTSVKNDLKVTAG